MRVKLKLLRLPKSEKTPETDEDAANYSIEQGLFVVADGVSDRSFSNIWSRLVVEFFIENPLFSNNPYEVQWWLEQVQPRYENQAPRPETLQPLAQEKARAASLCTFTSMRISAFDEKSAQAEVLGIGDSPILIKRHSGAVETFLIQECAEFGLTPVCLPSKMIEFDRSFNQVQTKKISFAAGETLALVTDAVASWVLCAPMRGNSVEESFQLVTQQTDKTWKTFIEEHRRNGEMVDDDSTAIILELGTDSQQGEDWKELGMTTLPVPEIIQERRKQLTEALQTENWERVAILWGDGKTIQTEKGLDPTPEQVQKAHAVADSLSAVRGAIRRWNMRGGDPKEIIGPVWDKHRATLDLEPTAANLRSNLLKQGIITDESAATQEPSLNTEVTSDVVTTPAEGTAEDFFGEARQKLNDALAKDDDQAILDVLETYQVYREKLLQTSAQEHSRILLAEHRKRIVDAIITEKDLEIDATFKASGLNLEALDSEYRARIEQASERAPRVEKIKKALNSEDFESTASLYDEDIVKVKDFSGIERRQIFHAVEIVNALKTFRAAIAGGDEQEIVRIFHEKQSLLLESKKLSSQEMTQAQLAERCVEMPGLVRAAISINDDRKILESYDKQYEREFTAFTRAELTRIKEAQTRVPAAELVRGALTSPDDDKHDERIASQKEFFDLLEESNLLEESEKEEFRYACERFERVKKLQEAIAFGDDREITKRFEQLKPHTKLASEIKERSEYATKRVSAADSFRRALLTDERRMTLSDAETILSSYNQVLLDDYPHLAADERAQLEHARFIVQTEKSLGGDGTQVWHVSKLSQDEWNQLDVQQQQRIQNGLRIFAARIHLRRATVANDSNILVRNYDPILEELTDLTPQEQIILKQAKDKYKSFMNQVAIILLRRR